MKLFINLKNFYRYLLKAICKIKHYNLLINTRVANKRTNLGNIYLENTYINKTRVVNVNTTSLIKKKGTNCGIIININNLVVI